METLLTALQATDYPFALYAWDKKPSGDYGVLSLESGADFIADGIHAETGSNGYVDLFTTDATSTPRSTIETVLNDACYAWELISVQFEDDTRYIHYEWEVSWRGWS